jgi:hypothetical protein
MLAEIAMRQALTHGRPKPSAGPAEEDGQEIQACPIKLSLDVCEARKVDCAPQGAQRAEPQY